MQKANGAMLKAIQDERFTTRQLEENISMHREGKCAPFFKEMSIEV